MSSRLFKCLLTILSISPLAAFAQNDTLVHKLDSLQRRTDTVKQVNNTDAAGYNESTKITFPVYFTLLFDDLKQEITSPFRGNRQDWQRFAGLAAGTALLSLADKPIQESALKLRDSSQSVRSLSKFISNVGGTSEIYTLAALSVYGFAFRNEKVKTTSLLATQAYISAAVIETSLKYLTSRERPTYVDPATGARHGRFHGPFYGKTDDFRSFVSGHATAAFSAATVYAMEYRKSVWVPVISYTSAALISLSRITENKHWSTDVLLGATLGYLCGRKVVNNYHRYARLKNGQKTGSLSLGMEYNYGIFQPNLVYRFN